MIRTGNTPDAASPRKPFYLRETWLLIALLFFIALLYFRYLPVSYDFDGTVFSQHLRYALTKGTVTDVIHPHHLFYMPANFYLYKILQGVTGSTVLEYFHFQVFSLVFGLLTLWATYKILKRFTGPGFFSLAGTFLAAASYGLWYHSVEANEYVAGLFFVTLGAYILFTKPVNTWYTGLSALFFALAAGFHLTNGLIVASALMFFFFIHKTGRWKNSLKFLGFYFFYLAIPYIIFYFVTGYNIFNLVKKVVVGGKDIFAGYAVSYWSEFSFSSLLDSFKSVGENIIATTSPVFLWVSVIFLVLAVATIITAARNEKTKEDKRVYLKMLCWLLPYMLFFSAWDNRHTGFKLSVMLPLLIMLVVALYRFHVNFGESDEKSGKIGTGSVLSRNRVILVTALLAAGIFCINFFSAIYPATLEENNPPYMLALEINKKTPENAVILISGCGANVSMYGKIYIPYFGLRRVMVMDWLLGNNHSLDRVYSLLQRTNNLDNHPVYILSELKGNTRPVRCLLENHKISEAEYNSFMERLAPGKPIRLFGKFSLYPLF